MPSMPRILIVRMPMPMLKMLVALSAFVLFSAIWAGVPGAARAQTVIRDAEIEEYMAQWFAPVFEAADMQPEQVKIILVMDPKINAFVAGGANIFFYSGLLLKTDSPGEVAGVMAHELGHVSGGHLTRVRGELEKMSYETILGTLIGIGAAAASGESGAAGVISGAAGSMARRRFLASSRVYESSADQAALTTLEKAGLSPQGFLSFLQKLESEELLPGDRQSEYVRTHPLTRDRIGTVENMARQSKFFDAPLPAQWKDQHALMKAKLLGYINPQHVPWVYDDRDDSAPALYARAVAAYRQSQVDEALTRIGLLIGRAPDNPYFHELKAQILFEFGRVDESLPVYQKAVALRPQSGLIRLALAHAQIESAGNDHTRLRAAIENLNVALRFEPRVARAHRLLATAYGRMSMDPQARLHLAEEALLQRKLPYARQQAQTAAEKLEKGSPDWLHAQDILSHIANQKKPE